MPAVLIRESGQHADLMGDLIMSEYVNSLHSSIGHFLSASPCSMDTNVWPSTRALYSQYPLSRGEHMTIYPISEMPYESMPYPHKAAPVWSTISLWAVRTRDSG